MLRPAEQAFWDAYCAATGATGEPTCAFAFGDSEQMADELLALVLHGPKRATAGLARYYGDGGDPMPHEGACSIVLDGRGLPQCIIRTTEVQVKPLSQVDEQFAWDEGEGDRSLAWWMKAHVEFFTREAERDGFDMHPDIETVLERFEVVWPARS